MKDDTTPNTPSINYKKMIDDWDVMNSVLGGTKVMRAKAEKYLPQHTAEAKSRYHERLTTAVLFNQTEETLERLSGEPFSEPITVNDDVPEELKALFSDVDMDGNNLDSFCKAWFKSAIAKGFCHVLIEFPRIMPKPDGSPRTAEDDMIERNRPYLIRIEPENVISIRKEKVDGVERVVHARIRQSVIRQVGDWGEVCVPQVLVLDFGRAILYEQKDPDKEDSDWVVRDDWNTAFPFVPLVSFYTDKRGILLAKPPLLDLAYLNIAHWQSSSDQRNILSVSRFPQLAASGVTEEEIENLVISPWKIFLSEDPQGKYYYVEHNGESIRAGAEDLQELESKMSAYGGEFLKKKSGTQTATERALNSAEAMSKLQSWANDFEDKISLVLSYLRLFQSGGKDEDGGSVQLVSDFGTGEEESSVLDALTKMRERKDISRKAIIQEFKRRDILDERFDDEADWEQIMAEIEESLEMGASLFEQSPSEPPVPKQDDGDNDDD